MILSSPPFICTTDGRVVPLKFIESFHTATVDEDATVNKLKGNSVVNIRTISGAEYTVSLDTIHKWLDEYPTATNNSALTWVYEVWANVLKD